MRRLGFVILIIVAMVTGGVLGNAVGFFQDDPLLLADQSRDTEVVQTVEAFYDAINLALDAGDTSGLDEILAPDFMDRSVVGGSPRGVQQFDHYVTGIAELFPGMDVVLENIEMHDEQVMAHVSTMGLEDGELFGSPVEATAYWNGVEILRVQDGQITERLWSDSDLLAVPTFLHMEIEIPEPASTSALVWQIDLDSGQRNARVTAQLPMLLLVAQGSIRVEGNTSLTWIANEWSQSAGESEIEAETYFVIDEGDLVVIPAGGEVRLQLSGYGEATGHLLGFEEFSGSESSETCAIEIYPCEAGSIVAGSPLSSLEPGMMLEMHVAAIVADVAGGFDPSASEVADLIVLADGSAWVNPVSGDFVVHKGGVRQIATSLELVESGTWVSSGAGDQITIQFSPQGQMRFWMIRFTSGDSAMG